jgi:hypothetical protein
MHACNGKAEGTQGDLDSTGMESAVDADKENPPASSHAAQWEETTAGGDQGADWMSHLHGHCMHEGHT